MDALKRAEEAKRQGQLAPAQTENPSLSPSVDAAAATSSGGTLPPLPDRLELLDKEFFGETAPQPAYKPSAFTSFPQESRPAPASSASPAAAQVLFDAKQPPKSSRPFMLAVVICTLLAVVVIGAYFWWQLQPHAQAPVQTPPPSSAVVAPLPTPPATPASQATSTAPAVVARNPIEVAGTTARPDQQLRPTRPPRGTAPRSDGDDIHFTASHAQVDPTLSHAYTLLQNGDRRAAQAAYQTALRNDPGSLDALHGLAAIAVLNQDNEAANSYYQRALELDPRDPIARAGIGSLPANPLNAQASGNSESRLRSALAEQPASATLNFALGNLLASTRRWPEAQQAYFQAVAADGDNPDYLFNLAISLDQLRKGALAGQYYQRALTAAAKRSHSFDTAQATERLKALQQ